jgi:hypothetical protein
MTILILPWWKLCSLVSSTAEKAESLGLDVMSSLMGIPALYLMGKRVRDCVSWREGEVLSGKAMHIIKCIDQYFQKIPWRCASGYESLLHGPDRVAVSVWCFSRPTPINLKLSLKPAQELGLR